MKLGTTTGGKAVKITTIGSSSAGNAYLVEAPKAKFIIELGLPWKKILPAINFDVGGITAAFVSHSHGDHCKSVKDAIKAGIDCYMSMETAGAIGVTGHHRVKTFELAETGERCEVVAPGDGCLLVAFPVEHDAPGTVGFVLVTGDYKLLFITDTAYCRFIFPGITHVMVECNFSQDILDRNTEAGMIDPARRKRTMESHMSLERVVDLLEANDTSRLREVHLLHLSDGNSNEAVFKSRIQQVVGVPVYVAGK